METISFNGKNYNSIEEMSADQRAAYEQVMAFMKDENNNGIPDLFEGDAIQKMIGMASTRVMVNGQEVQSFDSLPPETRAKFEKAMVKLSQFSGFSRQRHEGFRLNPHLKLRRANLYSRNHRHLYKPLHPRSRKIQVRALELSLLRS